MSQFQNMNQVAQTPIKGRVSNVPNPATLSAQVSPLSTQTLFPGSAVYLTTDVANMITVDKATPSLNIFGFLVWNPKRANGQGANSKCEIALPGSVMEMESAAAFNRGSILDQVVLNDQVTTHVSGTPIGIALDTASGANVLVRVYIQIGLTV